MLEHGLKIEDENIRSFFLVCPLSCTKSYINVHTQFLLRPWHSDFHLTRTKGTGTELSTERRVGTVPVPVLVPVRRTETWYIPVVVQYSVQYMTVEEYPAVWAEDLEIGVLARGEKQD